MTRTHRQLIGWDFGDQHLANEAVLGEMEGELRTAICAAGSQAKQARDWGGIAPIKSAASHRPHVVAVAHQRKSFVKLLNGH